MRRSNGFLRTLACIALLATPISVCRAEQANDKEKARRPEPAMTLLEVSEEAKTITFLVFGQPKPLTAAVGAETQFSGTCLHCLIPLTFKADEGAKKCSVCPCGTSNAECFCGKGNKGSRWSEVLRALPRGTVLRAEFNTPDKSESGLKRLFVDHRVILLPLEGQPEQTETQLQALVKPFGATKVELSSGEKQPSGEKHLLVTLKDNWTTEKAKRLEKALTKAGLRIASLTAPNGAK